MGPGLNLCHNKATGVHPEQKDAVVNSNRPRRIALPKSLEVGEPSEVRRAFKSRAFSQLRAEEEVTFLEWEGLEECFLLALRYGHMQRLEWDLESSGQMPADSPKGSQFCNHKRNLPAAWMNWAMDSSLVSREEHKPADTFISSWRTQLSHIVPRSLTHINCEAGVLCKPPSHRDCLQQQ